MPLAFTYTMKVLTLTIVLLVILLQLSTTEGTQILKKMQDILQCIVGAYYIVQLQIFHSDRIGSQTKDDNANYSFLNHRRFSNHLKLTCDFTAPMQTNDDVNPEKTNEDDDKQQQKKRKINHESERNYKYLAQLDRELLSDN